MYAIELDQSTVTLHVADVERSRQFYEELLGLAGSRSGDGILLEGLVGDSEEEAGERIRLRLSPRIEDAEPSQWLSIEVSSVTEVLDLYLLAIILGARAQLPRKDGERWNTVVTDLDGYRLSIWTHVASEPLTPGRRTSPMTRADRSPRLRWETAHRRGDEARSGRAGMEIDMDVIPGHGEHRPVSGRQVREMDQAPGRDAEPAREGV